MSNPEKGEPSLHKATLFKNLPKLLVPGARPVAGPSAPDKDSKKWWSHYAREKGPGSRSLPGSPWSWSDGDDENPSNAGGASAGGESADMWDLNSEREEQYLEEYRSSARGQLKERFQQCTTSYERKPAPTLDEVTTTYASASNDDLLETVVYCARWICYGARMSICKGKDLEAANALQTKWTNCDGAEFTDHMKDLVIQRSKDELRAMLADAFADIEGCIEEAKGDESGLPIVKAGANPSELGKNWY